jgi:hypothetical protein
MSKQESKVRNIVVDEFDRLLRSCEEQGIEPPDVVLLLLAITGGTVFGWYGEDCYDDAVENIREQAIQLLKSFNQKSQNH